MNHSQLFMNRELSWLEFNQRVLDEAGNQENALMDRLFFLTITASNLDEFFMVRVGGLNLLRRASIRKKDFSGFTPVQQLKLISARVKQMNKDQYSLFADTLITELAEAGIRLLKTGEIDHLQKKELREVFTEDIFPALNPIPLDNCVRFPILHNLDLYILVELKTEGDKSDYCRFAAIPIGKKLNQLWQVSSEDFQQAYVMLEDIVISNIHMFFHGREVLNAVPFRITRNADMSVQEEFTEDLSREMEKILKQRKSSGCVRLEVSKNISGEMLDFLSGALDVHQEQIFKMTGPIDLTRMKAIIDIEDFSELRSRPWPPQNHPDINPKESIFSQIQKGDILLSHPFQSFDPVVNFIAEAADDPDVLAIKQILYRTSPDSPIIQALQRAAANGKYVTAVVEIKARFDEASNIKWARKLEDEGVQVIYGVKNFKTHSKICLVVRREAEGIRRYLHLGTGNYNDRTAKLYTDVGLLTCEPEIGQDASAFFNALCGQSLQRKYRHLRQSPVNLRSHLITLIDDEITRSKQGHPAGIVAKMNSLADPDLISALYRASQAGVKIKLIVRGICCLLPEVKGLSDNITVISIIDRFLEHSRIFCFLHGGKKLTFISSADWMTRNMDRRVELLVPVNSRACKRKLIRILDTCLSDNTKARKILSDGSYISCTPKGRTPPLRSQEDLYNQARNISSGKPADGFQTHRPPRRRN